VMTYLNAVYVLDKLRMLYRRMGYHFLGFQAVAKPCHWLKKSLLSKGKEFCYKQLWYGIPSHRCLQMSPVIVCNLQCLYCWRAHEADLGLRPVLPSIFEKLPYDDPELIVEESLRIWKGILAGFLGNPKVSSKMAKESFEPIHVTFSLTGEPLIYPYVNDLISLYFERGFKSVFIVTNGTYPEKILNFDREPSQLYVTLPAPNEEVFLKVTRPLLPNAWNKVLESLEALKSIKNPTVVRLTMVKGLNMLGPEEYAKKILKAEPTYVEVKAAMNVGFFRKRLSLASMPRHEDIVTFANELVKHLPGYRIIGEYLPSRVVLISRLSKPIKIINA